MGWEPWSTQQQARGRAAWALCACVQEAGNRFGVWKRAVEHISAHAASGSTMKARTHRSTQPLGRPAPLQCCTRAC